MFSLAKRRCRGGNIVFFRYVRDCFKLAFNMDSSYRTGESNETFGRTLSWKELFDGRMDHLRKW